MSGPKRYPICPLSADKGSSGTTQRVILRVCGDPPATSITCRARASFIIWIICLPYTALLIKTASRTRRLLHTKRGASICFDFRAHAVQLCE
ncbi:hypothetical protein BaRGS_00000569 [Batillaria attramentaria]|uniref:Uncharacterized protein n=1 Tax=Batillaria attramentaria TaxID=370345 RepID=A0ABD0M9M6_9CAEN